MLNKVKGWFAQVRALAGSHVGQQVGRFLRVAVLSGVVGWIDGGHLVSRTSIAAAAAGGVEVAYRQWRQTVTASTADSLAHPSDEDGASDPGPNQGL